MRNSGVVALLATEVLAPELCRGSPTTCEHHVVAVVTKHGRSSGIEATDGTTIRVTTARGENHELQPLDTAAPIINRSSELTAGGQFGSRSLRRCC